MSDYLGNLITRTLSHEAFVRPRLPSLFEASPVDHLAGLELENEVFPKAAPAYFPAPTSHSADSDLEKEILPGPTAATPRLDITEQIQPAISVPTESVLDQAAPAPIVQRSEGLASNSTSKLAMPAPRLLEPEMVEPRESIADGTPHASKDREPSSEEIVQRPTDRTVRSKSVQIRTEAKTEAIAAQSRKYSSPAEQVESDAPDRRANADTISIAPRPTENSQPDFSSRLKPALSTEKAGTVKAIVPAIRNVPHVPSTPAQAAPAISVTIGRVEIRATTTPPPPQRAQPKSSKILSLESYLQQRAKGDQR